MKNLCEPLGVLSDALGSALHRDLPDIEYASRDHERFRQWRTDYFDKLPAEERRRLYEAERSTGVGMGPEDLYEIKQRRPSRHDVKVEMFVQTWGSSALGYGGAGCAEVMPAYTVVVSDVSMSCVYFGSGGLLAYRVSSRHERFMDDMRARHLVGVADAVCRYQAPDAAGKKWNSIESAPKDGRRIRVRRHMGDSFGYVSGTAVWRDVHGISGWIARGDGIFGELGLANPTEWQPL